MRVPRMLRFRSEPPLHGGGCDVCPLCCQADELAKRLSLRQARLRPGPYSPTPSRPFSQSPPPSTYTTLILFLLITSPSLDLLRLCPALWLQLDPAYLLFSSLSQAGHDSFHYDFTTPSFSFYDPVVCF